MEVVVPWSELEALVEPYYPKAGTGRRPVGLVILLRTYFMQQWFNLSDPGVEEAFYESATLRRFAGVDLGVAPAPDETTVLRFRHLLEKHDLGGAMLDAVNLHLAAKGIRIETGTIVDATIIHAPSSTKNEKKERDPAMRQTRKGKQWYFGLKAHVVVDAKEGHVPSVATSSANVSDVHMLPDLLHGEERKVRGDGGYQGQTKAIREAAPKAQKSLDRPVVANRLGSRSLAQHPWPGRTHRPQYRLQGPRLLADALHHVGRHGPRHYHDNDAPPQPPGHTRPQSQGRRAATRSGVKFVANAKRG